MSNQEWLTWQKQVIHSEEYKDIKIVRDNAQHSFDQNVKDSLKRVERYVN